MWKNLEFKAKIKDFCPLEKTFEGRGAVFVEDLKQVDTYFCVSNGRLKFREISGKSSELIFYERDENSPSGMQSNYDILSLADASLKSVLVRSLGIKVIVEKKRRLLKLKNARVHLDEVKYLGQFLEFEVVSEGDETGDADLLESLKRLAEPFVIQEINCSYSDLMILGNFKESD